MPEGHHTHFLAGELNSAFLGRPIKIWSPQGRFEEATRQLAGARLERAFAVGKHVFLDFGADRYIHIHLGLIGKLRFRPADSPPTPTARLRIESDDTAAELTGPQTCRLSTEAEVDAARLELGPDPLDPGADRERAWARIHSSKRSIASLLMDQRIAAGVGNIYRAEVLFRARLDPYRPGVEVSRRTFDRIWQDLVELMPLGVRDNRIDTVRPEHTPEAMGRPPRDDAHGGEVYVYRRHGQECLVCGGKIRLAELDGRNLYWCPRCQRRRATGDNGERSPRPRA